MRIFIINVTCGVGSTGRICTDIAKELIRDKHQIMLAYGRGDSPPDFKCMTTRIGSRFGVFLHTIKSRLFDLSGFGSFFATKKLIRQITNFKPDVVHLHNIHGYYINVKVLFKYLKKMNYQIVWTLHDCWSFTGHCAFFDFGECKKWKSQCSHCKQKKEYPKRLLFDNSRNNYLLKKELFCDMKNLVLVSPSSWLANLVKESFLKNYKTVVINNGVSTTVFKPHATSVHKKLNCEGKRIVLGVASVWDKRKGLSDFIALSKLLDSSFLIVLVGLNKSQLRTLPSSIIGIEKTNSVEELADLYSAAYVFVNLTYEDNYPTTNLEAISCGTPVVTYNTGGSGESACEFGYTVNKGDIFEVKNAIEKVNALNKKTIKFDCVQTAKQYIGLYKEMLKR